MTRALSQNQAKIIKFLVFLPLVLVEILPTKTLLTSLVVVVSLKQMMPIRKPKLPSQYLVACHQWPILLLRQAFSDKPVQVRVHQHLEPQLFLETNLPKLLQRTSFLLLQPMPVKSPKQLTSLLLQKTYQLSLLSVLRVDFHLARKLKDSLLMAQELLFSVLKPLPQANLLVVMMLLLLVKPMKMP